MTIELDKTFITPDYEADGWIEQTPPEDDLLAYEGWLEPALVSPQNNREFRADDVYLEAYQSYVNEKQAEQARLREEATRRQAAQAPAKTAPKPPEAAKVTAQVAPAKNGSKASRKEPSVGQNFPGPVLPPIKISGIPPVQYELITDRAGLERIVPLLMDEPLLSVDTETTGLDPFTSKLLLVQVATPQKCYVIDAQKVPLELLKPLLENEKSVKLFQNGKFDYKFLKVHTGIKVTNVFDTYLSERLITAGLGKEANLAAIVERYLGERMDKSIRKTFFGLSATSFSPEQLAYAARDVMALFPIFTMQVEKLKEQKLMQVADLEFRCLLAVGDLELNGCKLNVDKWRGILTDVAKKRDIVRADLMDMLPSGSARQTSMFGADEYVINLNSAAQIMTEFRKLGIELEGTSEAELNKHNHPVVKKLLEYRGHEKTLGSFGEGLLNLINKQTGRIHPDFQQYGADTGRFSCSNPNVQQIPATSDFRACFVAEPGYKLVTSDYSQAELRILAELSGDEAFLGAFRNGGDLHKLAASQMFGVTVENVSKEQRSAAKAINFGLAYGMGAQGLAVRIDKTVEESRELINAYFKAFSGVQRWLEKAGRDSVNKGYAPTPLGRKRFFEKPSQDDFDYRRKVAEIERQGKNAPIQGCVVGSTRIFEQKHGYIPIEKMEGRAVSVWDGTQFSNATVVYSGKKQLVKIELWGGYTIECSPDHRFLMYGVANEEIWRTPSEFEPQDRVVLSNNVGDCRFEIPVEDAEIIKGKAAKIKSVVVTDEFVDMYDVVNSDTERFMANGLVVHNCNADMTKMALVFLREKLVKYDARMVNTVHDEIVVEVREDQAEEVCKLVEHEMIRAGQEILKEVPIVADAKVGDYWSK